MATIAELERDLKHKRTLYGIERHKYEHLKMTHGGLKAEGRKLIRIPKDDSPAAKHREQAARASMARSAKAVKAAEVRLDEATLRAARPTGTTRVEPVYRGMTQFLRDLRAAATTMDSSALDRLELNNRQQGERRDTGPSEGGGFLAPSWFGSLYAQAIRVSPTVRGTLVELPWEPGRGYDAHIPRVEIGASVGLVDAGDPTTGPTETDVETATADSRLGVVSGVLDVDLAVYERADEQGAVVWMRDLYAATDALLEDQIVNGTGSSEGSLLGLLNVLAQQTAHSYTSASPTPAEFVQNLAQAKSAYAAARLAPATHVLMHPRRMEWAMGAVGTDFPLTGNLGGYATAPAADAPAGALLGMRVVPSTVVPTDLGAGSDQDPVVLYRGEDVYWSQSRRYLEFRQVLSGKIAARVQSITYARLFANRYPTSILQVTGTGLTAPSGY